MICCISCNYKAAAHSATPCKERLRTRWKRLWLYRSCAASFHADLQKTEKARKQQGNMSCIMFFSRSIAELRRREQQDSTPLAFASNSSIPVASSSTAVLFEIR